MAVVLPGSHWAGCARDFNLSPERRARVDSSRRANNSHPRLPGGIGRTSTVIPTLAFCLCRLRHVVDLDTGGVNSYCRPLLVIPNWILWNLGDGCAPSIQDLRAHAEL